MRLAQVVFSILIVAGCRCTTSPLKLSAKNPPEPSASSFTPSAARLQVTWQQKFESSLLEMGSDSEGWAMFSDSPMGHTGQQLVIQKADGSIHLCYAPQVTNECTFTALDQTKWKAKLNDIQTGDQLSDRRIQTLPVVSFEYVHLKNVDGKLRPVARVFFMDDGKPLPKEYDKLVDVFTQLNK